MRTTALAGFRVLISGAGVAGPALALRLAEYGAEVTVVEIAPALRGGGFGVDFRGPTHMAVLQRLGVLDELRARQTHGNAMTCVDANDQEIFTLPATFTGGELEVLRRDLSQVLYERGADRIEYLFGDTVTALEPVATLEKAGLEKAGLEKAGLEKAGLEKAGHGKAGHGKAGHGKAGHGRTRRRQAGREKAGLEEAGHEGAGLVEAVPEGGWQARSRVRVRFREAGERIYDLVVGADGMHSTIRRLAFGPETRFVRYLGYHIAGWSLPNTFGLASTGTSSTGSSSTDSSISGSDTNGSDTSGSDTSGGNSSAGYGTDTRQFNVPGRMASITPDPHDSSRVTAMMVFRNDSPFGAATGAAAGAVETIGAAAAAGVGIGRLDQDAQKKLIAQAFAGLPWHVPVLLDSLPDATDLYFDTIARVNAPQWTAGSVVLLGDAAWGATLGGMGVGTGLVGAHVLAGELALAGGDHQAGLAAYEQRMRRYAGRWQKGANAGRFLAPASRWGLATRNRLFASSLVRRALLSGTSSLATDTALPDYP